MTSPSYVTPAQVGKATLPAWLSLGLEAKPTDCFVFPASARAGLPPGELGRLIRATFREVVELRPGAVLWVPVFAPHPREADWFRRAVRETLWGMGVPYAVTSADVTSPASGDFSVPPVRSRRAVPAPTADPPRILTYSVREQQTLFALTRLRTAVTAEIAAQLASSEQWAYKQLKALLADGCVRRTSQDGYRAWEITRRGVLIARRGWGIPPGIEFEGGRERSRGGRRHRRTARLWPAWLRQAYADADVWAGWSEPRGVGAGHYQPDAIAWGRYRERETLFWLEVESGTRSRSRLRRDVVRRVEEVSHKYADYRLIYAILTVPWAGRAILPVLKHVHPHVAVVIGDWKRVGKLPRPRFGGVACNVRSS